MNTESRHLSNDEIARFCGQKMPPAQLLMVDKHLTECDACYARLHQLPKLNDKLIVTSRAFSIKPDDGALHLTYEQLVAVVDQQLDEIDREIAESHLESCSRCEIELNDLRQLAGEMQTILPKAPVPMPEPTIREKFLAFWQLPAFRFPALATLGAAFVVLLAVLILLPLRRENAELRAKVAELEQTNDQLKAQAGDLESLQNEIATLREEKTRLTGGSPAVDAKVIELNDGGNHITLDGQGKLAGLQTSPAYEQAIKETLQSGRVKITTKLTNESDKTGTLMGNPANSSFRLVAPINIVIESDRPLFQWQGLTDVATFKVTIFDENLNKIAESETINKNQWKITNGLRRGQTYLWQVRATANNQEIVAPAPGSPRVKFKVLEQAKIEELENARRMNPKSHLIMGILYADVGLLEKAEREFNALLKANPQSTVARRLLQSVKAAKR